MKICMQLSYSGGYADSARQVAELEKRGLDLVWVAEAYGFDGVSLMGFLAAVTEHVEIAAGILPIYSRTPTLMAMTAAGVDELCGGRFSLGLGASGPQVIEGWHGVPYDRPLGRTREIIDVCRQAWAREAPLEHHGRSYDIPLPPERGTGLGKALKIIGRPRRDIDIWVASLGAKNVEMTAELANGWLPLFFHPDKAKDVWGADLAAGRAKRDPSLGDLMIAAGGIVSIGHGAEAMRDFARPMVALYVGGMGARGKNFYNELVCRYGFEAEAKLIQDLYLDGKKDEAAAAVPEALLEATTLCGSAGFVKERLAAFGEAGVTHLNVIPVPVGGESPADLLEQVKGMAS